MSGGEHVSGELGEELGAEPVGVRAFLIADIRGYTRFTQEQGDEAAARLTGEFAATVKEIVEAGGGQLIEVRGDEALVVFTSTRAAVRAALALREVFIEKTIAQSDLPLLVGIGLDAGEAVAVQGGFRGGALNTAARLCSQAKAGEILATSELVHLVRKIEGVRYSRRGKQQFKGLSRPVDVVLIAPDTEPVDRREAFAAAVRTAAAPRQRNRLLTPALVASVALVVASIGYVFLTEEPSSVASSVPPRPNAVGLLNVEDGTVEAVVDVGLRPIALASGDGSLWVANEQGASISRLDPINHDVLQTVPLPDRPVALAFGGGALFAAIAENGTIVRINPATNTVVDTLQAGSSPVDLVIEENDIWVADRSSGEIRQIDGEQGDTKAIIPVGEYPSSIALDDDLWVSNYGDGTVARIDPQSEKVVKVIGVGNGPSHVAAGEGSIWVTNSLDATVSRISPESESVIASIQVGRGPNGVAFANGQVWVTNEFDGTISQIDPATNNVVENIEVGEAPQAALGSSGDLWFTTRALSPANRGGTLNVVSRSPLDSIDPAIAYTLETWSVLSITNDGLVGFKKVGGAEGATLVPDLAAAVPQPTEDGREYTFRLRKGLHYSTGHEVSVADVQTTFERLATIEGMPAPSYYSGITGWGKCAKVPEDCDLSQGVVTDEDSGTVTFRLTDPDPEFLHKLALPFAMILPDSTPKEELSGAGDVPATGPYMVKSFSPERVEVVRNPKFEEWEPAIQPDGYVDRIVINFEKEATLDDFVKEDGPDVVILQQADEISVALRDHTGRTNVHPSLALFGMAMNTAIEPFDDVRVRRAINYAADRERVVELWGGSTQARLTCQVLPPSLPGYTPYCPYTEGPENGQWSRPDMARARALIDQAGVAGMRVEVRDFKDVGRLGGYFTQLLNDLGFRAVKREIPQRTYFAALDDADAPPQMFIYGWIADYPEASNFINLFDCETEFGFTHLCDESLQATIDEAHEVAAEDPQAARELWEEADRRIVDLAPWVFALNQRVTTFISPRLQNYQYHFQYGVLLSQVWVD